MNRIELIDVEKKLDEFVIGPINLTFEKGTVTALIGENGAGKSTVGRLIMDLVHKDKGKIIVDQIEIGGENENWKEKISFLPQSSIGIQFMNGKELKELNAYWYSTWNEELFNELIDQFQVPLDKKIGVLSQGVQQKLAFIIALSRDTEILILDEPTAHLDIPAKKMFTDCIVDWMRKEDKTVIISSHQVEDIRKLADYLVLIKTGKLIGKFEKEELTRSYQRFWTSPSLPNEKVPGEIVRSAYNQLISNEPEKTESYFVAENISVVDKKALELEEVITILLSETKN